MMEILVGLCFIVVITYIGYKKFKNAEKGKDCCK